jgi:hypothetical protein
MPHEADHLASLRTESGRFQGDCTCGWRSPLQREHAAAARLLLDHACDSPCHARVGSPQPERADSNHDVNTELNTGVTLDLDQGGTHEVDQLQRALRVQTNGAGRRCSAGGRPRKVSVA